MKATTNRIDYTTAPKILEVKNLRVNFSSDSGLVYAVRGVSFDLYKGETLCIVGESGSGKSVTSKTIMGILANNAIIESGQILYEGEDLVRISEEEFHRIRGHKIGMIFQDPLSSLNPITRVGKQITEATLISRNILKKHYNDLISKQLVALRNVSANVFYEKNKIKAEIARISSFIKTLESKKEIDEDSDHQINEFIVLLKNNIDEDITSLKYNLDHYKAEDTLENKYLEEKIKETNINLLNERIEIYEKFKEVLIPDEDRLSVLKNRTQFLKDLNNFVDKHLKTLKPIYAEALKLRKKDATVENKEYKKEVDAFYVGKIKEAKAELKIIEDEMKKIIPSLKEDQFKVFKNIIDKEKKEAEIYSPFARYLSNSYVKGQEINISKIGRKEEERTTTGNEEFDAFLLKRKDLREKISTLEEEYATKTKLTTKEAKKMALEVMKEVGIPLPEKRFYQYPFEFSGGMRQRIVIAIALTANPDILICDEPTTALDVTIQAQILELINRLKKERGLSCIFITHDLGVVANMADRVAVMYAGKIVEYGTAYEIFYNPKHPYTWALLSSIPDIDSKEKLEAIPGTPPDMRFPPKGDAFALRSKYALAIDFKHEPPFFKISDTHYAATWLLHEDAPKVEMPRIVKTRIANSLKAFENEQDRKEVSSYIPKESFDYIEQVSASAKQKLLSQNIKAYQYLEEGSSEVSKDTPIDQSELDDRRTVNELEGVHEDHVDEELEKIKSKCKVKEEYVKNNVILSVNHLKQYFFFGNALNRYKLKAVHDVSFQVKEGECFGIVGESGCGKTTTGRCIMRLYHITSGSIYYKGQRIAAGSRWNEKEIKYTNIRYRKKLKTLKELFKEGSLYEDEYKEEVKKAKDFRNDVVKVQKAKIAQIKHDDKHPSKKLMSEIQMIFQDPIDSLDPRMTVEDIIQEGLKIQGFTNKRENHQKVVEALERVGLIADYCNRYPHEFSGGQRQRIGIARALIMNPKLLICDEPISALDVSIRAQIINLLNELKEQMGLTIMFIAHDLSVVKYFCDRIAVMYFGEVVELATSDELFKHPLHPYTKSLLSAIPKPNPLTEKERVRIVYDPSKEHDYSFDKPSFVEIAPNHWILANKKEVKKYKEEIKAIDEMDQNS